ncbi:DUF5692 family protein [Boudabousia marimammalium]|nr:DUF5692 family protein [Boudabousia marimammalium]
MSSLFLWEAGPARVYLIWLVVLLAQIAVAEINRRWNWTIFVFWTAGGIAMIPYAYIYGLPIVGWFPFGKYLLMVATATMTGWLLVLGKKDPVKFRRWAIWMGALLWLGLVANIMEANVRDITIYFNADRYYQCAADWQCLQGIANSQAEDMLSGLPEARGLTAVVNTPEWFQALAANFEANHVGIDPDTGFRTIGGYWNIMSAVAGLLNCITVTGLGKIIVTTNKKEKVKGLIWVDMIWPWVIAYDLWNHAFLYNSLADYTWYCTLALLLACTIPAFTWAKGQWIWFRCFTLMFWIAFNNLLADIAVPPGAMTNFATMDPNANIVSSGAALIWNVVLFIWWLYLIIKTKRNPITNALFFNTKAFAKVVKLHADDADKYFLTDMIPETPAELGYEPESLTPPVDGFVGYMPWWGKEDRRYPKLRTPVSADPVLAQKGVQGDPKWEVTSNTAKES